VIDISYLGAFLVGLMGAGHCLSMCGGIIGALSLSLPVEPKKKWFTQTRWKMMCCYHSGRISSYILAGILVASLTQFIAHLFEVKSLLLGLRLFAGVLMIAIGFYFLRWWSGIKYLEYSGKKIWKHIEPHAKKSMQLSSKKKSFIAGSLWGWLPCGLVYSALTWALASGDPIEGGVFMGLFGLGTLPGLLVLGTLATQIKHWIEHPWFRTISALFMMSFGCHTIWVAIAQMN
jgi:uncharacterized protein